MESSSYPRLSKAHLDKINETKMTDNQTKQSHFNSIVPQSYYVPSLPNKPSITNSMNHTSSHSPIEPIFRPIPQKITQKNIIHQENDRNNKFNNNTESLNKNNIYNLINKQNEGIMNGFNNIANNNNNNNNNNIGISSVNISSIGRTRSNEHWMYQPPKHAMYYTGLSQFQNNISYPTEMSPLVLKRRHSGKN